MRILQVSSAKNFGGGEKHLVDLMRGLAARGHEVFLAAPGNTALRERLPKLAPSLTGENFLDIKIRHALDIPAARRIAKFIRENNIDVVHAHLARDYVPASLAARFSPRAKLVLTRHVLFPMNGLQKFALSNVSRVIAVSRAVETGLRGQRIFPAEKIVTIPNGIDVSHWMHFPRARDADIDTGGTGANTREDTRRAFRQSHGIPDGAFLIGTVGELKKLKGQEDLILAAEMILRKFPGAYFVIVGRDNSPAGEYLAHLQNLAAAIDAADRFIWLDWVEDTAPLLHALDVFVSASHSESFGLAILEAMASACAVVSSETEGAKELLGDKNLVPLEDPVKLAKAVCGLLGDDEARKNLGGDLQLRARENFALEKMIGATEKLYLEL